MHCFLYRYFFMLVSFLCLTTPLFAVEPVDPRRPPAITTEGVPVVPEAIFARLQQYQNMRAAMFQGWSPDGRGILISTRFGNAAQLHRVYNPGGRREQITFFDEPAIGRFIPQAADGACLATISQGGSENFQIYLLDRAAYRTVRLTDGKSRNELGPVREDGTQMIVHSNRRNGRDTDLYLADCRTSGSEQMLLETKGQFWVAHDWSPDGRQLLLVREVSINESYPATFDIQTKQLQPIGLPAPGKSAVGQMAFAADGRSCYLTSDCNGEFLELMRLDLATRKYQSLSHDITWDVTHVEVEPTSGQVAFVVNEDGASRVYLLNGDKRKQLDIPLGTVDNLDFSPDGSQLGFTLSRARRSGRRLFGPPGRWPFAALDLQRNGWAEPGPVRSARAGAVLVVRRPVDPGLYFPSANGRPAETGGCADQHPRRS